MTLRSPVSLAALALSGALLPAPAFPAEFLPLDQIRPGMEGTGRTVFEGTRVQEFGVRILGVLENAVGPKQSVILARLEGEPLETTGVIAGMSGSPVFVDGKLVGAVAYAFPFGKEPIAGITPIGEMIEATRVRTPRAASARFHAAAGPHGLAAPLTRAAVAAAIRRPVAAIVPGEFHGGPLPSALAGSALTPLALPLTFSGFDPETFRWASGLFSAMGFVPVLGGTAAANGLGPLPDLAPGAAVGVSLIEGDLDVSVTGTITAIDDDRVYAFGHPFFNLGPTQFPMKKACVYSIFPSLQVSWKIAAALDEVGTVDQDRTTAIAGRLGPGPRMIPVSVSLRSDRGGERRFHFRIVEDELFTPVLAYVSLLSVLQGYERAHGSATLALDARLEIDGDREVRVQDVFAADQPAQQAAALVAGPLALLVGNDFEKVKVKELDVTVAATEEDRSATIVRAWVDPPGRLKAGARAAVKVQLRTHRGDLVTESLPLRVPPSASPGDYTLLVADADTVNALEQREMRQPFAPRDMGQLLRALNSLRDGNRLYARLTRPGEGAIVAGEYLPSLPESVLSVLRGSDQGASVVPIGTTAVWTADLATDHAISGARRLTLTVEP
jgi:SpoIVB peptidase S55